jgi:lipoate-protein ligase A
MKKLTDKQTLEATTKLLLSYDKDVGKLIKTIRKSFKKLKSSIVTDISTRGLAAEELNVTIKETIAILENTMEEYEKL